MGSKNRSNPILNAPASNSQHQLFVRRTHWLTDELSETKNKQDLTASIKDPNIRRHSLDSRLAKNQNSRSSMSTWSAPQPSLYGFTEEQGTEYLSKSQEELRCKFPELNMGRFQKSLQNVHSIDFSRQSSSSSAVSFPRYQRLPSISGVERSLTSLKPDRKTHKVYTSSDSVSSSSQQESTPVKKTYRRKHRKLTLFNKQTNSSSTSSDDSQSDLLFKHVKKANRKVKEPESEECNEQRKPYKLIRSNTYDVIDPVMFEGSNPDLSDTKSEKIETEQTKMKQAISTPMSDLQISDCDKISDIEQNDKNYNLECPDQNSHDVRYNPQ